MLKPGGHLFLSEMHRDGQTEPQLTVVYLHHSVAAVDTALGVLHKRTLTRQELVDNAAACHTASVRLQYAPFPRGGTELSVTSLEPITQRLILAFWLPLAASWVLMTLEGPFVQAAIARLPDPETSLAAFGIVVSLSITIEAPVIMLLATSTALSRNRDAYVVLRRFMVGLILILTVIAAVVAFTPVYDWIVPGAMGVPEHVATAARPGMAIMTLWSAAIGWRRFYQGILIRFGHTRRVTYGTVVRLLASAGTAAALALWGRLPGVWVGSIALMAGVLAEAVLVTWLVRPALVRHLSANAFTPSGSVSPHSSTGPLTMQRVIGFHAPLAATSLLTLLSTPVISAGLARMAYPERSLAAWPVAFSIVLFTRSFGLAMQEVVIALTDGPSTFGSLWRFSLNVAIGAVVFLALIAFTPLADFYLREIAGLSSELASFAVPGLQAALLLPGLTALQSWLRAVLMKGEATGSIYQAMGLNLAVTAAVLAAGVALNAPGIQMAAVALTVAMVAELVFLGCRTRRLMPSLFSIG